LARSYSLCPFCYNNPPFESMKEGDGCMNCPHPECPQSYMRLNSGVMVLDPQSHPKWRLTCNRCPSVVAMFDGALKFRVTESSCPECEARIVCAEYKGKSPLPDEKSTFKGCMFCDENVKDLVNLHHAFRSEDDHHRMMASHRGRRGRGRGRGGPEKERYREYEALNVQYQATVAKVFGASDTGPTTMVGHERRTGGDKDEQRNENT
uniref:DNA topoisomerase n=1 Tax=Heligmosomoides polygyrus TaxID=6339 RepID=A0A183F835_HELPZ